MTSTALIPTLLGHHGNLVMKRAGVVLGGVIALSLLAQVAIPLPFTPVPITGQTFAVTLLSLLLGRTLGLTTILSYLTLGAAGLPVFAMGKSGLMLGPTMGYLVGMAASSFVVGGLADRGFTRTFPRAWLAGFAGSAMTFAFGLIGLSFFVPADGLFQAGLLPFLPGDLIKTTLAASIATALAGRAK